MLLHAIGLDADQWRWCSGLGRAWAVTLPGHGGEPLPADGEPLPADGEPVPAAGGRLPVDGEPQPAGGGLTLDAVADVVADRIACRPGAALAPVDLVGLSLGGMVAQHLALRHPELVRSLVLVCTKAAADPDAMLARADATERLGMGPLVEETLQRWFTPVALGQRDHPGVAYARARLAADDPGAVAAYWRAMAGHDLRADLGRIGQPVTVVSGRHDVTTTAEADAAFAACFARGRLEVCEGPHLLSLEAPAETTAAVVRHLQWVEGPTTDAARGPA